MTPNRFHIRGCSLLFLYNMVSARLNQTHHSMLAIVIIQSSDFFFLLLVLHSVRLKKEQVCDNSGFAFNLLKRAQWPKFNRRHESSTRLNTSEKVK